MSGGRPPIKKAPEFGRRLAAFRKQAGLSQLEFSVKVGITRAMVDYYERRAKNPTADFIIKVAAVLDISTDELLGLPKKETAKAGRKSTLDGYIEQVKKLPKSEQRYVVKFLEQVVGRNKEN